MRKRTWRCYDVILMPQQRQDQNLCLFPFLTILYPNSLSLSPSLHDFPRPSLLFLWIIFRTSLSKTAWFSSWFILFLNHSFVCGCAHIQKKASGPWEPEGCQLVACWAISPALGSTVACSCHCGLWGRGSSVVSQGLFEKKKQKSSKDFFFFFEA